jgi:hypothetical protein
LGIGNVKSERVTGIVSYCLLQFLEELDKDFSAKATCISGQHAPYQVNLPCWNGAFTVLHIGCKPCYRDGGNMAI